MPRTYYFAVIALMCLALFTLAFSQDNLLVNGSFDDSDSYEDGWVFESGADEPEVVPTSLEGVDGNCLVILGDENQVAVVAQYFPVEPGQVLKFSLWFTMSGHTRSDGKFQIEARWGNGEGRPIKGSFMVGKPDKFCMVFEDSVWTFHQMVVRVPEGATECAFATYGKTDAEIILDECRVVQQEIVADLEFESGEFNMDSWINAGDETANVPEVIETDFGVTRGAYVLNIPGTVSESGELQATAFRFPVSDIDPTINYSFSGWINLGPGDGKAGNDINGKAQLEAHWGSELPITNDNRTSKPTKFWVDSTKAGIHTGYWKHFSTVLRPDDRQNIEGAGDASVGYLGFYVKTDGIAQFDGILLTTEKGAASGVAINEQPNGFVLSQNYPNPFNPATHIDFHIQQGGHVDLSVYNITGQKVRTLFSDICSAGAHIATWDGTDDAGRDVTSGVYFYQLRYEHKTQIMVEKKRMLLLK